MRKFNGNSMFNVSENVTSYLLNKHTPRCKVPDRSVLLDRNRSHERRVSLSAERLRLESHKSTKCQNEPKTPSKPKQVVAYRNLQKLASPKEQIKKSPVAVQKPVPKRNSPLEAPKKRDLAMYMQTSMKYGENIAKIMQDSSISPKKQDRVQTLKPNLDEFNLADAIQKAKLCESKSLYVQVRELQKQQIYQRKNSINPDSGNTTERLTVYKLSNSGLSTQRAEEERVTPSYSAKRLSRRVKTFF